MRAVLALPGYVRYLGSRATNWLGDSLLLLVLSMWVKTLTGSNGLAGLTFVFTVGPSVVGPFLGVLIDRLPRKATMLWGDLITPAFLLPLFFVRTAADVWLIWLAAGLYGIAQVVLPAASQGILKILVPAEQLGEANGIASAVGNVIQLVAPLAGAALFAWRGGPAVALADIACFLVAAAIIATLRLPARAAEPYEAQSPLQELTRGMRHLAVTRVLRDSTIAQAILMSTAGFLEGGLYALTDALHRPATFGAVIVALQGVGMIVGALVAAPVIKRLGEVGAMIASLVVLAAGAGLLIATTSTPVVLAAAAIASLGLPAMMVAYLTLLQRCTPERLIGRVQTAANAAQMLPYLVSMAVGAVLVAVLDWRVLYGLVGLSALVAAGYLVLQRSWRGAGAAAAGPTPSAPDAPAATVAP